MHVSRVNCESLVLAMMLGTPQTRVGQEIRREKLMALARLRPGQDVGPREMTSRTSEYAGGSLGAKG